MVFVFVRIGGWTGILVGLGMWYEVGRGLWYGEIEVAGQWVKPFMFPRDANPAIFYGYAVVYSLIGLALIALGIYILRGLKNSGWRGK